jgi:RecA/RadA recombinase
MAANKWMARLQKLEGAVLDTAQNPYLSGLDTPSPSFNFIYGKNWLMPFGFSTIFYGPPAGGKSLLTNAIIGHLHKTDPEAIAVKYNTELRELGQLTDHDAKIWGIDRDRYVAFNTNKPDEIFDPIVNQINADCQEGSPIKLIIIDSMSNIAGRRSLNADSINTMQIGDEAATLQAGLKMIMPVYRKHKIHLIMTVQVRDEMDPLQKMRGNDTKMAASWYLKHAAEYYVNIERDDTKNGKSDLLDNNYVETMGSSINDPKKMEISGHRIRFQMKKSSVHAPGRSGALTFDYRKGIINTHEEVFLLGTTRGVIQRPNNVTYTYKNDSWRGMPAMLEAIKNSQELYDSILKDVKEIDVLSMTE